MTIPYDQHDQQDYYSERSFYITAIAGLEPQLIGPHNYETLRELIMMSFSGPTRNRLLVEAGNILFFAVAVGFGDENA